MRFLRGVDRFFGPRLRYNTQDDTGVFEGSNFILRGETTTMRGKAERLEFLGKDRFRLVQGSFTSCEPGKEDWRFEGRELEIDQEKQRRHRARRPLQVLRHHACCRSLTARFPSTISASPGFSRPSIRTTRSAASRSAVPYYWNIAPERDLTLTPGYMTKRGEQLKTDFRYMDRTYFGEVRYDFLPHDNVFGASRSAFSMQHEQRITPRSSAAST